MTLIGATSKLPSIFTNPMIEIVWIIHNMICWPENSFTGGTMTIEMEAKRVHESFPCTVRCMKIFELTMFDLLICQRQFFMADTVPRTESTKSNIVSAQP
jgi:hypothetical protein